MKNWLIASCVLSAALLSGAGSALADVPETEYPVEIAEPEMAQRFSMILEGFNLDDECIGSAALEMDCAPEGTMSLKTEADLEGIGLGKAAKNEVLRFADGDIYVNIPAIRSLAKALDLELPNAPFYSWVKLPGLYLDALEEMIWQMPALYDWEDAFTLLSEQIYSENDNDEMELHVDSSTLQIAAMLLDQLQNGYVQAVGSLDLNKLAGAYGNIILDEAAIFDGADLQKVINALPPYYQDPAMRLYAANPDMTFGEMCLKIRALKLLTDLNNMGYYSRNVMLRPVQMLLGQISNAFINRRYYVMDWRQILFQALAGEAVDLNMYVSEDGSFSATMQPDNLLVLSGRFTDRSLRGSAVIAGEDAVVFSAYLTERGMEAACSHSDEGMVTLSLQEKLDEGSDCVEFTLKQSDRYNTQIYVRGCFTMSRDGYDVTISSFLADGGYVRLHSPLHCSLKIQDQGDKTRYVLSLDPFQSTFMNLESALRLTVSSELAEPAGKQKLSAVDISELFRYIVQKDFQEISGRMQRRDEQEAAARESEDPQEAVESIEWESESE